MSGAVGKSCKHKGSIQDLTTGESSGIEETEVEMEETMGHVDALQDIFDNTEEFEIPFSAVQRSDLLNLGVERKQLGFNETAIQSRIAASDIDSKHGDALCLHINRISRSTNRRLGPGARMILCAVLLTLADISLDAGEKHPMAIFPHMQIGPSDGVLVQNAKNEYNVWLTGNVDYGICTYRDAEFRNNVLYCALHDLMLYARNGVTFVDAKRDGELLVDCIPEATSQAVALSEVTGNQTIRYCLSDGSDWMFLAYTRDKEGNRISYEGPVLSIMEAHAVQEEFVKDVRRLVEVLYYWLRADSDIRNDPLCELHDDST